VKYSEIKDMTVEELRKKRLTMKTEMFDVKMKHSLGQVNNPLQIRFLRKDIARVNTAINQKLSK